MAGFYYFVPGHSVQSLAESGEWRTHGLMPQLADIEDVPEHATGSDCTKGPGGDPGVIITPKRVDTPELLPRTLQYRPEFQSWRQAGDVWLGWLNDEPPGPEDLKRRRTYPGYAVTDDWSHAWSIPIARSPEAPTGALPTYYVFDAGRPVSRIKPQFEALWDVSGKVWDYFNTPREQWEEPISQEWLIHQALAAMAVNYRLGEAEINALAEIGRPPLDSETATRILLALIDWQTLVAFKKKETPASDPPAAASPSSGPGGEADCETTHPAAAS